MKSRLLTTTTTTTLPRAVAFVSLLSLAACAGAPAAEAPKTPKTAIDVEAEKLAIEAELVHWHAAASEADEARYFDHFAKDAVFLGTDATERWDLPAFRAWAHPFFAKGKAWSFRDSRRAIHIAADGRHAWFDEDLMTDNMGPARGSGVMVREDPKPGVTSRWKLVHYNLALTIPNERLDEVHALLEGAETPSKLRDRYKAIYEQASAAALSDLPKATKLLADLVPEAKKHPEEDIEFWLHNELTWLRWAQDDLPGALSEVDAMRATLDRQILPADKTTALRLHERWDRAYILLEMAMAAPREKRTKALSDASSARESYESLAKSENDHDGLAALGTFFAARLGKKQEAVTFAKKVDIAKRDDVQDLYIFQLAYEAAGDMRSAGAARAKICATKNYLMRPLILRRGAKEGWKCP